MTRIKTAKMSMNKCCCISIPKKYFAFFDEQTTPLVLTELVAEVGVNVAMCDDRFDCFGDIVKLDVCINFVDVRILAVADKYFTSNVLKVVFTTAVAAGNFFVNFIDCEDEITCISVDLNFRFGAVLSDVLCS